jgi:light-regulated signal transduction histidine kinase (bacteriophytochrome)
MQPQQLMNAFPLPIMPDDQMESPMTVQRWGALLVCEKRPFPPPSVESMLIISQVSENVDSILSYSLNELILHPLSSIVDTAMANQLMEEAEQRRDEDDIFAQLDVVLHSGASVHLVMHVVDDRYIIDVLPVIEMEYSEEDFNESVEELTARLRSADNAAQCSQHAADVINRLVQYDRCVVYRWIPPHSHGEIIAESLVTAPCAPMPLSPAPSTPPTMPFLGLRFPPHPISDRVSAVYHKIGMRIVADTNDTGALLVAASSGGVAGRYSTLVHLDLKYSVLRAISPRQSDQFLSIGVRAAATSVIFVEGKAWGAVLLSVQQSTLEHNAEVWLCPLSLVVHLLAPLRCRAHNSPRAVSWRTVTATARSQHAACACAPTC